MRMCARFGWDHDALQWRVSPGEFESMLAGAVEGEQHRDRLQAMIVAGLSDGLSVAELLGLEDDGGNIPDDFRADDEQASKAAKYARYRARLDADAAKRQADFVERGES